MVVASSPFCAKRWRATSTSFWRVFATDIFFRSLACSLNLLHAVFSVCKYKRFAQHGCIITPKIMQISTLWPAKQNFTYAKTRFPFLHFHIRPHHCLEACLKTPGKIPFSGLFLCASAHRKKHKALISKYKPYILKYVPCIFKQKPCIFSPLHTSETQWLLWASQQGMKIMVFATQKHPHGTPFFLGSTMFSVHASHRKPKTFLHYF